MKRFISRYILILCAAALCLSSCSEDKPYIPPPPVPRTVFIYMAADNSLGALGHDGTNISNLVKYSTAENLNGGKIVIYHDIYKSNARMVEISADDNGEVTLKILEEYDEEDSSNPETLSAKIRRMTELAPANSYGLILWSHCQGWIPTEMHGYMVGNDMASVQSAVRYPGIERIPDGLFETRGMLQDSQSGSYMDLDELVNAIPKGMFDFIINDMCFTGQVEMCYALRNHTKQMVISPAEVIAEGMPYHAITGLLMANSPRLGKGGIAEEIFKYYDSKSGTYRSATTAHIDCTKMDAFASVIKQIIAAYGHAIPNFEVSVLQTYDRYKRHTSFDVRDFVRQTVDKDDPLLERFEKALSQLITYKETTGRMLDLTIDPEKYSGLSTYLPIENYEPLNEYYKQTEWYKAVYK